LEAIIETRPDTWVNDVVEEHIKSFAEVLRDEICKEPETKAEKISRLAKEETERRKARFDQMDPKWQVALRTRV
jgi:hypothetical protein